MRKLQGSNMRLLLSLLCMIPALTFWGCNSCNPIIGHPGASDDIDDSREKGMFICEYVALKNPIIINDTLKINVKEAWLERTWYYDYDNGLTAKPNRIASHPKYQLCINSREEDLKNYGDTWYIGVNSKHYIRPAGKGALMSDYMSLPKGNKEVWLVQAGNELANHIEKKIIGKFELVKK